MLSRFLLLLILLPLVELALLFRVADAIRWGPTMLIVLGTGFAGLLVARHQGLRTLRRIQEDSAAGRQPADTLVDGLLVLLAGIMLMIPGILTDLLGLALLIPPVRRLVRAWFAAKFAGRMVVVHHRDDTFVDVEATGCDAPRQVSHRVLGPPAEDQPGPGSRPPPGD